jgi:hypothetical protein
MSVPYYFLPATHPNWGRVSEKLLFIGLPHAKLSQPKTKQAKKKGNGPNRASVVYEIRKGRVVFTVKPLPPKPKEKPCPNCGYVV